MKHIIFTAAILLTTPVYAGSGHDHGHSHGGHRHAAQELKTLGDAEIIAEASKALPQLVEQKLEVGGSPLNQAWKKATETGRMYQKGNGYFIVSFDRDESKSLY